MTASSARTAAEWVSRPSGPALRDIMETVARRGCDRTRRRAAIGSPFGRFTSGTAYRMRSRWHPGRHGTALQREAERLFGPGVSLRGVKIPAVEESPAIDGPAGDPARVDSAAATAANGERTGLTSKQMRRLWKHALKIEDFWQGLSEIRTRLVARLAALASTHRWEVLFLTQRPASAGHPPSFNPSAGSRLEASDCLWST